MIAEVARAGLSDDTIITVVVLGLLAAAVAGGWKFLHFGLKTGQALRRTHLERVEASRSAVEKRILELFIEFPERAEADPAAIAQLVHDELVNDRVDDDEALSWANAETARRLYRTVEIEAARAARKERDGPTD